MKAVTEAAPGACELLFPEAHRVHTGAEVEWWYQFAFLSDRFTLMSCFWRYQAAGSLPGLMGCYAVTEIQGKRRWRGTWIDRPMLEVSRRILQHDADPDLFTLGVLEATQEGECFAPYQLSPESHLGCVDSLDIALGQCRLIHDFDNGRMLLNITGDGFKVELQIRVGAVAFPMNTTGEFQLADKRMSGYTFPQASVSGCLRMDGQLQYVEGKAWLDHQWGEWFGQASQQNRRQSRPEWRYFAIPFDNGQSLVVAFNKHRESNELVYGCLSDAAGRVQGVSGATVRCRDRVESLRTRNVYEYGWTLDLPDFDTKLDLIPFHPNHEVFTFTRERGIQEFGVEVSGTFLGSSCRTRGFVEVCGDTIDVADAFWNRGALALKPYIQNVAPRMSSQKWLQRAVHRCAPLAIENDLVDRALLEPLWSMVDRGGKAWRSSWFALCCYALGYTGCDDQLLELMPIVELIHTGSLIIDDIQDESTLRRGEQTVHRQIGADLAINVGNFLYFLPMLAIQESSAFTEAQRLEAYRHILIGLRQGHIGQAIDLMWSKGRLDVSKKIEAFEESRDQLMEQYLLKCGCQLEAAAHIAGSLSRAPDRFVNAISEYSRAFGVAYQLIDDLKDAAVHSPEFGKSTGEDLRNGRLNMVLLHALAGVSAQRRKPVVDALANGTGAQHIDEVRDFIAETGALNKCLELAESLVSDAYKSLEMVPPSDARIILRCVPQSLFKDVRRRLELHG